MQTLISRAHDISPRASQCNISRKHVCLRSSLSLSFSSFSSPSLHLAFVRITHYVVTKLYDLSSNCQHSVGIIVAQTKILQGFVALTEISSKREEARFLSSSFLRSWRTGCALMYGMCIGLRKCVRDRAWPYVTMRAPRSRASHRVGTRFSS